MKRTFIVAATILVALSLAIPTQASSTWTKTYPLHWSTNSMIGTSDGGYALAGGFGYTIEGTYTGSGSLTRVDFFLTKIDANGFVQWTQRYSGGQRGDAEAASVIQTSDGGYALAGKISDSVRSYQADAWLVKTNSEGKIEWNHTYAGPGVDFAGDIIQTSDGGYAIAGSSYTNGDPALTDFWLAKTDALGNIQWTHKYGTPENYEVAYSLVEAPSGGYALVGNTYNFTSSSIWLVKVDPSGDMEWNQTFGAKNGTSTNGLQALVATSDGGYALIGGKTQAAATSYGAIGTGLLIKTNPQGEVEWNQTYGTIGDDDCLSALIQTQDGGYLLAGSKDMINLTTKGDVWLLKIDPEGNMMWNQTYGGLPDFTGQYHSDSGYGLVEALDGGYVVLAKTEYPVPSSTLGEMRVWLIKTDEEGVAPALSDVSSPITSLPPLSPQNPTFSKQSQLPGDLLLTVAIVGVGASLLTVLSFKMKNRSKIES
jgi:hypothetical protein